MKVILVFFLFVIGGGMSAWWYQLTSTRDLTASMEHTSGEDKDLSSPGSEAPAPVGDQVGKNIEVYSGIVVPDTSTVLDVSDQQLSGSLKAEVRHLKNLVELNLSNNQFTGIPAEIGQLHELRILNLAGNPMTGLPYELGNLQNLQQLDLRDTNYAPHDLDIIRARLPSTVSIIVE